MRYADANKIEAALALDIEIQNKESKHVWTDEENEVFIKEFNSRHDPILTIIGECYDHIEGEGGCASLGCNVCNYIIKVIKENGFIDQLIIDHVTDKYWKLDEIHSKIHDLEHEGIYLE